MTTKIYYRCVKCGKETLLPAEAEVPEERIIDIPPTIEGVSGAPDLTYPYAHCNKEDVEGKECGGPLRLKPGKYICRDNILIPL